MLPAVHFERRGLRYVFRPTRVFHGIFARRQFLRLAVGAIDLRVKGEVRRQPLGLRRIDQARLVADDEHGRGRLIVLVADMKRYLARRKAFKQQVHLVAITDVLCALADVESDLALAFAGVAAVELNDPVFQGQAAQHRLQGLHIEHLQVQPELGGTFGSGPLAPGAVLIIRNVFFPGRIVDRLGVAAYGSQLGRDAGFVVHLDQELPPALLDQFRFGRPGGDLHARLRVDVHAGQTILVEHALDGFGGFIRVGLSVRRIQRDFVRSTERCPEIIGRFDHAPDLRDEWLQLDILDDAQGGRLGCRHQEGRCLERARKRRRNQNALKKHGCLTFCSWFGWSIEHIG